MARKKPVAAAPPLPAPLPETAAPAPTELLTGPRLFARRLTATEARWWRYVSLVALSSVLSGVAYALLVRPAANFTAQHTEALMPGFFSHVTNAVGSSFLGLLTFGLMWGLGRLGAGQTGRAAEVYGATFALFPPLWLLVILWSLLTPAAAFVPAEVPIPAEVPVPADVPAAGQARQVELAALHATAQTPAAFLLMAVTLLGTLAQFALAYPALRELTGRTSRALMGTLLPLLPALIVQFIGIAPLLVARPG